jgi:uncharacterized membrane protein/uncharacterized membrane protein YphA (DoxX/SURF4 family)
MNGLLTAGRLFFAIAMVFFGAQFLIFVSSMRGPIPGPPWSHGVLVLDWLACVGFILAGVSIASGRMGRWVAMVLGVVLLLYGLLRYVPALVARVHDPGPWTVLFEILAMVGGAWVLAASFSEDGRSSPSSDNIVWRLADVGRLLIAVSLVVFAVQHFMYARFVATLIPAWIPARLFWAYFTGIAFVAAAVSIATKRMLGMAAMLLGTMFFLWVVLLHAPRVAGAIRNGNEVTSLLVAVAMCGLSFVLAGTYGRSLEGRGEFIR